MYSEDTISLKKRRKRSLTPSPSPSSSRTSRSKSQSKKAEKKKSKKSKKKSHHRSKKRSKSKKKSQKKLKSPKSLKTESSNSRSNSRQNYKNMDINSHMMYPYPFNPRMMPNNNFRPYFPPPYMGNDKIRPPIHLANPNIKSIIPNVNEMNPMMNDPHPPDKIVKDQNFLNSDEKLFESIVNSEMNIRSLYEDVQISENYASSILYKTIKKLVNDPNTVIFDENKNKESKVEGKSDLKKEKSSEKGEDSPKVKNGEILKFVFEDFNFQNSRDKMCINFGDMSEIKEALIKNNIANLNNALDN